MLPRPFLSLAGKAPTGGIRRFIVGGQRARHVLRTLSQPRDVTSSLSSIQSLPTVLTSVKVFDGSEITDAVVVSNNFWSTLSTKLPYLLLAQLMATIAFVVIASLTVSQGKFIIDQVVPDDIQSRRKKSQFRRFDYPPTPPLDFSKLFLCIVIDTLGAANEVIPLVGELIDVVYAPVAALLLRQLFAGSNAVFLLEFAEEVLPFTDVLPLATICWVIESFFGNSSLANVLRIGEFAPIIVDSDVIDMVSRESREDIMGKMPLQFKKEDRTRT